MILMPDSDDFNAKLEIELLKRDILTFTNVFNKFDKTTDKMQELIANMSRMVTIIDEKQSRQHDAIKYLADLMESRRIEQTNYLKEVDEKLHEIYDHMDSQINNVTKRLDEKDKDLGGRLKGLESWKILITGGLIVAGYILGKLFENYGLFIKGS